MPTNEALALRVREGDSTATEQLWKQVKRYAYTIVRRYGTTATVDFDDLMQTAYFGMLRAALIYDGEHAFLPILSYAIRNTCRRLYSGHCIEAEASLDAPLGDEESFTLHDAIADERIPEVTEAIELEELQRDVRASVDALPERQAEIIRRHYFEGMTLKQIAECMEISTNRVRTIEQAGFKRLRDVPQLRLWHQPRRAECPQGVGVGAFLRSGMSCVEREALDRLSQ